MLVLLLLLALATRIPYLLNNTIPFSFDHGRDLLAVLDLVKTGNLKFIGPWTSIPGLFFGPLWYYLLAPGLWLTNGNPIAPAGLMLMFGLIEIALAYKYLGIYEAIIFASAPAFINLSTSAANPFPMVLIGLLILIALKNPKKHLFKLGLLIGVGFHFSSALAIFYLIIIPLILILRKIKLNLKILSGFLLPFIPQLLFEIKNNFIETKALIAYFIQGESQQLTLGKIQIVTKSILNEFGLAILPDWSSLRLIGLGLWLIGFGYLIWKKQFKGLGQDLLLLVGPMIGFWLLHYNVWYVYGLLPVAVVLTGKILRAAPKWLTVTFLTILSLNPGYSLFRFYQQGRQWVKNGAGFLPRKLEALDYVESQAQGKPYRSYQYLPNIYDYAYQYLYFWRGFNHHPLPEEFSYQPGEISYVAEKLGLLQKFPQPAGEAEKTFLIIEKPENTWHYPLEAWLKRIDYSRIVSQKDFGPELEVWEVQ